MVTGAYRLTPMFLIVVTLVVVAGCGDDTPAGNDDIDAEPGLSLCDVGFRQDPDLPAEFLEEFPDGCVPQSCGIGRWGNLEVGEDTIYVDAWVVAGGDGSEAAPFSSIQAGLDAVGAAGGGPVAVAAGTYLESLVMTGDHDGVHLAGRCRALTVVDSSQGEDGDSGIFLDGFTGTEQWKISGLTLTGAPMGGLWMQAGYLQVEGVALERNQAVGINVTGVLSDLLLDDVEIRDTQPLPNGTYGRGIDVSFGASLTAMSCVFQGNAELGMLVDGNGTEVFLHDVDVRDTLPWAGGLYGWGIAVQGRAHLEATSCLVEGNAEIGIITHDSGTEVFLQEVAVRETLPLPDGTAGRGIEVNSGARLEASACAIEGNSEVGMLVSDPGTEVVLESVALRDTQPLSDGTAGRGIAVQDGARLEASHCLVERNGEIGVFVSAEGTEAWLHDVEVRDTRPVAEGTGGGGIQAQLGARLVATSVLVEGNADVGIVAGGEGTDVTLLNVEVRDTQPLPDGTSGRGIDVIEGARLEASTCLVEGNTEVGILAGGDGAEVKLVDVVVRGTHPLPDGTTGAGIVLFGPARLYATSCLVEGNADTGIVVYLRGAEAFLQDVEVRDTQPQPDGMFGRGITVQEGARLEATSCVVEGNSDTGIVLFDEGTEVFLQGVEVRGTQAPDGTVGGGISAQNGARLEATSCLIEGNSGIGLNVNTASVEATSCVVDGNEGIGVLIHGAGTEVVLLDSEVRGTLSLPDGTFGWGMEVGSGSHLNAQSCLLDGNAGAGITAVGAGTEVILHDVELWETRRPSEETVGVGLTSQDGANVTASELLVANTDGLGLFATLGGTLTCGDCVVQDNAFAGALAWASGSLFLSNTTIARTLPDANEGGGVGIFVADEGGACALSIDNTTIEDQPYAAVWLDGDGSYSIRNSTLVGGYGMELEYPDGTTTLQHGDAIVVTGGVTAWDGTNGLLLEGNDIQEAVRAGVLLDASSAFLTTNSFTDNAADLIWQDCEGVVEPAGLDDVAVVDNCPTFNHHIAPLEFNLYLEEMEPLE